LSSEFSVKFPDRILLRNYLRRREGDLSGFLKHLSWIDIIQANSRHPMIFLTGNQVLLLSWKPVKLFSLSCTLSGAIFRMYSKIRIPLDLMKYMIQQQPVHKIRKQKTDGFLSASIQGKLQTFTSLVLIL
jgi:hypothetical protein